MDYLIKNCHIISPNFEQIGATVGIKDGKISSIYSAGEILPTASKEIDANGQMLVPGFIDLHFHGAAGFDVCDGSAEGIEAIAKIKMEEGCTTICPTTLTLPEEVLTAAMQSVETYKQNRKFAKVAGVHLEGPYVNVEAAGAQNPGYIRLPNIDEVKRLNAISKVALITYAPEMPGAVEFTSELRKIGVVPSAGHSKATHAQIKTAIEAGLMNLTHFCNQMSPLHHREIGMVGAGIVEDSLYIEVISDKVHLSPSMLEFTFKTKKLDKICVVTDALAPTGLPDGNYSLGGLDIYIKDGAARLHLDDRLAGSTLRMNKALKNIHEVTKLPLKDLIATTSYNQAVNLGLENTGKIEEGYVADIVLLDANYDVQKVMIDGVLK
ncbi:MAG: N-acetylglucosamine-6-phosphate deacetylase, partial [Lentisphaeria bacterium]